MLNSLQRVQTIKSIYIFIKSCDSTAVIVAVDSSVSTRDSFVRSKDAFSTIFTGFFRKMSSLVSVIHGFSRFSSTFCARVYVSRPLDIENLRLSTKILSFVSNLSEILHCLHQIRRILPVLDVISKKKSKEGSFMGTFWLF